MCSASGCYMLLGWKMPLIIFCMYLEYGTDQEMSFFGGIHHLLVNHIPSAAHQFSDYFAHSSHPSEHCCGKGRGGFPCGGAVKKITKQSQKKEFTSVTALGPCPEAFSTKVKKHLHIDRKDPSLQCTWNWQRFPDVPHKTLLLVVSNLCVTSCMTKPKGDMHVRNTQAICRLGWIHLLCSSATFLCWIWTLSFYRKIWIELNLYEPSQICNCKVWQGMCLFPAYFVFAIVNRSDCRCYSHASLESKEDLERWGTSSERLKT